MKQSLSRKSILIVAGATILLAAVAFGVTRQRLRSSTARTNPARLDRLPRVMLWAWERPVDLRFIDTETTGVAFLSQTIGLRGDEIAVRPRVQPLNLRESTRVMAVVRIETDALNKPTLSANQRNRLAGAIAGMARPPQVSNIQIDFDATQSERAFYRELIFEVRRRLPDTTGLSMTALASWCSHDDWISDLPVDEAVPMLFRMAGDSKEIARALKTGDDFIAAPCRQSYGISTDEPRSGLLPVRRLYVFNPNPWTEDSVRTILEP